MNAPVPWRKPLLTLHIAAGTSALGAALAPPALGLRGLRGADPRSAGLVLFVLAPALPAAAEAAAQGVLGDAARDDCSMSSGA